MAQGRRWGEWIICGAAVEACGRRAWPWPEAAGDAGDPLGPAPTECAPAKTNQGGPESGLRDRGVSLASGLASPLPTWSTAEPEAAGEPSTWGPTASDPEWSGTGACWPLARAGNPPEKGATSRGTESPVRRLDPWAPVGELETGAPGLCGSRPAPVSLENWRRGRLVLGPLPALLESVNGPGGRRGADWAPTPGTLCHTKERA
ncbi:hypothetical protein NDU88_005631 [Pleurodeles waltl]|uniref:Uncharacterized protein n=1 Tax=Pleurodeles waltl TaxID=8319 RepID=A0AAV7WBJ7_PLEWA|nr:hypothetical protein NDU88_005631 [Pleurodeles waltl]